MEDTRLLIRILSDAALSLDSLERSGPFWKGTASQRLAFRELGLSIGLHGVTTMQDLIASNNEIFEEAGILQEANQVLNVLERFLSLTKDIEEFWLAYQFENVSVTWLEHQDINSAMLATSLEPGGYLVAAS
mmetsp:Transcript_36727/g.67217  ORF Transcript_36727/g.67217 Transcript_36727/m.67217 type:complete len:132 (-) Transcript_36727:22-417(-)